LGVKCYYNEFDPKAAEWLRQLIKNGDISLGDVDDRSITEVTADDLRGYDRVHFFAGIGTWDYALNRAGWGTEPVWTASLPCQPFSVAGKGFGKSDERHLLPHFIELVRQCKPAILFGEQVPGAIKHGWLDDLYAEMESCGYAIGSIIIGAHSIGAAHIRQRLYWVANAINNSGKQKIGCCDGETQSLEIGNRKSFIVSGESGGTSSNVCGVGVTNCAGSQQRIKTAEAARYRDTFEPASFDDWIYCRDGKYRPIKPGIQPLVDGTAEKLVRGGNTSAPIDANATQEARAMRLKGYGNAIQAQTAEIFIRACMPI